jgi:hypothetical protein
VTVEFVPIDDAKLLVSVSGRSLTITGPVVCLFRIVTKCHYLRLYLKVLLVLGEFGIGMSASRFGHGSQYLSSYVHMF